MSMLTEIGDRLAAAGLGLVVGTNLIEGFEPEGGADLIICLFQRPGRVPVRTSANTVVTEQPNLQVLGRGSDYEALDTKMRQIRTNLQNFSGVLGSATYLQITAAGAIYDLGVDERMRFRQSLNFTVMRQP